MQKNRFCALVRSYSRVGNGIRIFAIYYSGKVHVVAISGLTTTGGDTGSDDDGIGVSSFGATNTRTEISSSIVAGNTNSDLNLFVGAAKFHLLVG